jgi:pyruvate/2-oxoglutarate dehydrogenase complex dihydrolipoamide dehydrogenase (E3) component
VRTFAPDGYFREPIGPHAAHRGTAELRSFFTRRFSAIERLWEISAPAAGEPASVRREGDEYVLQFDSGTDLRGDRLLVATGRRPRTEGIGLETAGVEAGPHGIPVDEHLRAGDRCRRPPPTHAYAESTGFLTLLSDGERLTGAYALGPEAGERMQQATLAIRAHVPLQVLSDTIQPFLSFSGIYDAALKALRMQIAAMPRPAGPMNAQMASLPR